MCSQCFLSSKQTITFFTSEGNDINHIVVLTYMLEETSNLLVKFSTFVANELTRCHLLESHLSEIIVWHDM